MRGQTTPGFPCPDCKGKKKGVTENTALFLREPEYDRQSSLERRYAVCRACWRRQYKKRYGVKPPKDAIIGDPPKLVEGAERPRRKAGQPKPPPRGEND